MSAQVARQAVDLLLRESSEAAQCALGFSGGEPMLNWAVVRDAITYCQEAAFGGLAHHGCITHRPTVCSRPQ
jgi:sulfatase maturation enzyme AslB (radical SAM superfamily)